MNYSYSLLLVLYGQSSEQVEQNKMVWLKGKPTEKRALARYNAFKVLDYDFPKVRDAFQNKKAEQTEQLEGEMDVLWYPKDASPGWEDMRKFKRLQRTRPSRLVIFTHGNRKSTRVGGFSASYMAWFLVAKCGLEMGKDFDRISLVACFAGGDHATSDSPGSSFAADLHRRLKDNYDIRTTISARTAEMRVIESGNDGLVKMVRVEDKSEGIDGFVPKKEGSKFVFAWGEQDGQEQQYWQDSVSKAKTWVS